MIRYSDRPQLFSLVALIWGMLLLLIASPWAFGLLPGWILTNDRAIMLALVIGSTCLLSFPGSPVWQRAGLALVACVVMLTPLIFASEIAAADGLARGAMVWFALAGVLLVLWAIHRVLGWLGLGLVMITLIYCVIGHLDFIPDDLRWRGASLSKLMSHFWTTGEGVFGGMIGYAAKFMLIELLLWSLVVRGFVGETRLPFSGILLLLALGPYLDSFVTRLFFLPLALHDIIVTLTIAVLLLAHQIFALFRRYIALREFVLAMLLIATALGVKAFFTVHHGYSPVRSVFYAIFSVAGVILLQVLFDILCGRVHFVQGLKWFSRAVCDAVIRAMFHAIWIVLAYTGIALIMGAASLTGMGQLAADLIDNRGQDLSIAAVILGGSVLAGPFLLPLAGWWRYGRPASVK